MTSTAVPHAPQAETADQPRESAVNGKDEPSHVLGRQAQTPVRPGFEAIPPEVRPVGDRKPVAQAAEPPDPAARPDDGDDAGSVAAFWAY